jgi:SAM-dependent methyltransferase
VSLAAPEGAVFDKLADVRRERALYRGLARRIIATVLESYPPVGGGPVVEIGAGDGQLAELLPADLGPRIVHTEPTQRGVIELGRQFPNARIERASVERLPFGNGEVAAAIGLCVLDLLPDLQAAVRELGRVLAPGAPVIHFLDQSPFLQTVFERLVPLGLVPLPNVFEDPCASHWPQDLFFLETVRLRRIVGVLRRQQHPLAGPLEHYASVFQVEPFRVEQAILELDQISSSAALRQSLREAFRDAYQGASDEERSEMGEFRGHAVSSARELATRLFAHFSSEATFDVHVADILAVSDTVPARDPVRYQSLSVGQHRHLTELPVRTLVERVLSPGPDELLREHGILVFVATRNAMGS